MKWFTDRDQRETAIALTCLVGAVGAFYFSLLLPGRVCLWGDLILQFVPWTQFAHEALRHNLIPLWSPTSFCGSPCVADPQVAFFYPLNPVWWCADAARGIALATVLHGLIAATGTYCWLRRIEIRQPAALLGAMAFAFGGYYVTREQFPSLTNSLAWLPWLLWCVEKLRFCLVTERRLPVMALCTFTGIAALQLLAGHMQTAYLSGFCVAVEVWAWSDGAITRTARLIACIAIGYLIAAAAAAVQLLPTLEWLGNSTRATIDISDVSRFTMPVWQWATLLMPTGLGSPRNGTYWGSGAYWEVCAFTGVVTCWFALVAARRGGRFVRTWVAALAAGLILATGPAGLMFFLAIKILPGFHLFRDPARFLLFWHVGTAALGAFGLNALLESGSRSQPPRILWLCSITLVCCGAALVFYNAALADQLGPLIDVLRKINQIEISPRNVVPFQRMAVAMVGIGCATLGCMTGLCGVLTPALTRRSKSRLAPVIPWLPCLFLFIELSAPFRNFYPVLHRAQVAPALAVTRTPALALGGRILTPLDSVDRWWEKYVPYNNIGSIGAVQLMHGLRYPVPNSAINRGADNVSGYNPVRPDLLWTALREAEASYQGARTAAMFSRFAATSVVEFNGESMTTLPVPDPQPRYEFVPAALSGPNGDRLRVIPEATAGGAAGCVATPRFVVNTAGGGVLIVRDRAAPGWHARIDGRIGKVLSAEGLFRCVRLKAGAHDVRLIYYPTSVRLGMFVSLLAIAGLVAGITGGMLGRRGA